MRSTHNAPVGQSGAGLGTRRVRGGYRQGVCRQTNCRCCQTSGRQSIQSRLTEACREPSLVANINGLTVYSGSQGDASQQLQRPVVYKKDGHTLAHSWEYEYESPEAARNSVYDMLRHEPTSEKLALGWEESNCWGPNNYLVRGR